MIDIGYVFNIIRKLQHKEINCILMNLKFKRGLKNGFHSKFIFKFELCG